MWHYICKDKVVFKNDKDSRNGEYLVYHVDVWDRILSDNDWVFNNDAIDEQDYLIDYSDMILESNNGDLIFVPCADTVTRIETSRLMNEMEADENVYY